MRKLLFIILLLPIVVSIVFCGNRFWVGGSLVSKNWNQSDAGLTNWATTSGGINTAAVPTSSDPVFFDSNSGSDTSKLSASITILSLDCTGYTGVLTQGTSVNCTIAGNGVRFLIASGMTYSPNFANSKFTFTGTSGTDSIWTNGKRLCNLTFNGAGGTFQFQDSPDTLGSITGSSNATVLTAGTLDLNNKNIVTSGFNISGATTRALLMGNGTLTIIGANSNNTWNATTTTGLTFTAGSSTIVLTTSIALTTSLRQFFGGGLTYNNVVFTGTGTGTFYVSGSNTFSDLSITSPPHWIAFKDSTTQTITTFTASGTAGNLITLTDTTGGGWLIAKSGGGTVSRDYLNLIRSTASPALTFYAGTHSTDGGGNVNWTFTDVPIIPRSSQIINMLMLWRR